jgi:hypothetical protein
MTQKIDLDDMTAPQLHELIHHLRSKGEAKSLVTQELLQRFAAGLQGAPEEISAPIKSLLEEFAKVLNEIEHASHDRIDEIAAGFGGEPKTFN